MSGAYYNENDKFAAAWLHELIKAGLIADGEVDERSITDVRPGDVRGFTQCHFFAGIGGWSLALRLAGWPDDRPVWSFSCPCQKFSSASRGRAVASDMWPEQRRLIITSRPSVFFGEQVSNAGDWFDGLCADVQALGYEIGAGVLPAVAFGHDHARARIYFVGHANSDGKSECAVHDEVAWVPQFSANNSASMVSKDGISRDMAALSGFGNAIVPQVAQAFIEAYMDIT